MDALVMPQAALEPSVAELDFTRLKWKLTHGDEAVFTSDQAEFAETEYRKFLSLKRWYPGIEFVPSKLVDAFWHAHILDTRSYHEDCQRVFGDYLHHFPYFGIDGDEDRAALETAFEQTQEIYEEHFGEYPEAVSSAARCKDHSCHAPSECRCRTPGACK